MNYSAQIKVGGNQKSLLETFAPEGIQKDRSNYTLKKTKNGIVFDIKATDATALRATVNMITQLLAVYEKMGKIK
jgi:tRNA threonylcarbamoyladenosine modification (KEOPS) complex  Pcc1 subunit